MIVINSCIWDKARPDFYRRIWVCPWRFHGNNSLISESPSTLTGIIPQFSLHGLKQAQSSTHTQEINKFNLAVNAWHYPSVFIVCLCAWLIGYLSICISVYVFSQDLGTFVSFSLVNIMKITAWKCFMRLRNIFH